jgi:hypothetical protein
MQTSHFNKFSLLWYKTSSSVVKLYADISLGFSGRFPKLHQLCLAFSMTVSLHDLHFHLKHCLFCQIYPLTSTLFSLLVRHTHAKVLSVSSLSRNNRIPTSVVFLYSKHFLFNTVRHHFLHVSWRLYNVANQISKPFSTE